MPGSNPKNPQNPKNPKNSKKSQKSQKFQKNHIEIPKIPKIPKKTYRNHHRNPIDSLPLRVENSRKPWHLSAVQPFQAPLQRRAVFGAVVAQQQGAVGGAQDPGVACATGHPGKTWEKRGKLWEKL